MVLTENTQVNLDGWEVIDQMEETLPRVSFSEPSYPCTSIGLRDYICDLFYPSENAPSRETKQARLLVSAGEDIRSKVGDEAHMEILKLAGIAFELAAAYRFESIEVYISHRDTDSFHRNLLHPARTIALASFLSKLIYYDYQVRSQLLDGYYQGPHDVDILKIIDTLKYSHAAVATYHRRTTNVITCNDRAEIGLQIIKPDWNRVEGFNCSITPDEWRKLTAIDYADPERIALLKSIYPDINIDLVVGAMPKLTKASSYEYF